MRIVKYQIIRKEWFNFTKGQGAWSPW